MSEAVVYHWWGYHTDSPPISNLRSPILCSIATLRGVNPTIPIYVIDISDNEQQWMDFPQKLNFSVHRQKPFLEKRYVEKAGYRNLSRLFDMARFQSQIPEEIIIYIDSDVFYLNNILKLAQRTNRFCFNRYNSGFFYYNKNSDEYQLFQEMFEAYVTTALNDTAFRAITKQFGSQNADYFVLDEVIMNYMYIKHPNLFNIVQPYEHFVITDFVKHQINPSECRMFHANGLSVINPHAKHQFEQKYSRGLMCLTIQELYQNMLKSLDRKDIDMIYTAAERSHFEKFRQPLSLHMLNNIVKHQQSDKLYDFFAGIAS